jgi:hypothetical protein
VTTEWITPKPFIYLAQQAMGDIDLDPASSDVAQRNVGAKRYLTPDDNGLQQKWLGRVWLSPPQGRGQMPAWTGKLIEEYELGRVTEAILLVPNATDTEWCHRLYAFDGGLPWITPRGRIQFESPGRKTTTPANGQIFFYFGKRPLEFFRRFLPLGMGAAWGFIMRKSDYSPERAAAAYANRIVREATNRAADMAA